MISTLGVDDFRQKLMSHFKKLELDLIINENRSTMLHLLEKRRDYARLSMHRMFLDAPEEVISAIAHYVRGTSKERTHCQYLIRGYIHKNLSRYQVADRLNRNKLYPKGKVYDLQEIYSEINREYFENRLTVAITWYGAEGKKHRSRITFGQYYDSLKLIKIHRILDSTRFPDFFVTFVVYHEMLHDVIPSYVDEKGAYRCHGEEFKKREQQFADYARAIAWEKENRDLFFM